jgi:hypothetical protein
MPPGMLTKRWFAKVYGWPSEVVKRIPLDEVEWYSIIEQAQDRADNLKRKHQK